MMMDGVPLGGDSGMGEFKSGTENSGGFTNTVTTRVLCVTAIGRMWF